MIATVAVVCQSNYNSLILRVIIATTRVRITIASMNVSITRRRAHLIPEVGGLFLSDEDLVLFFLDGSRKELATSNAVPIFLQPGAWH